MKINMKFLALVLTSSIYGVTLFGVNNCNAASYPRTTITPLTTDLSMNQYKLNDVGDIISKGPWVDVRAYASINDAVTAIGSTQATLLIPNAQTLTGNLTIPSTLSLEIIKGGSIGLATYTLTINGSLDAGLYNIFSGSGTVKLSQGNVHAEWWGFDKAASAAVNAAAIQSAISSFIQAGGYGEPFGGRVLLGRGVFAVASDVITFLNKSNITLEGAGSSYGYDETYYAPTTLEFTLGTTGIDVSDPNSGNATSGNVIKNLRVHGKGILANGIRISNYQIIREVSVEGCTVAGLRMVGATNSSHVDNCSFSFNTGGAGVYIDSGGKPYTTVFTIKHTNLRANATGLYAEIGSGVEISNCVIESNTGYGLHLYIPDTAVAWGKLGRWTLDKVWFENNGTGGSSVYQIVIETAVRNQNGGPPRAIRFKSCDVSTGVPTQKYVNIKDGKDIEFEDCEFYGSTEAMSHDLNYYSKNISYVTNDTSVGAPTNTQLASGTNCRIRSYDTSLITSHGVTGSAPNNTPMTLFTMSGPPGMYMVLAYLTIGEASYYYSNARIAWDGSTSYLMKVENGLGLSITVSGANVQGTQTSGPPQEAGISWKYMVIR